jgi:hypothetical protein
VGRQSRPFGPSLVPHGHSKKTAALRADLLIPIFSLQDGQKNEKKNLYGLQTAHHETPIKLYQNFFLPPAALPGAKLLKKFDQNFSYTVSLCYDVSTIVPN